MQQFQIRHTREEDMDAVMAMFDHSRSLMRAAGNYSQWAGYPTRGDLMADIQRHASYLAILDGRPVGTFALVPGTEPTYAVIEHGRWIDDRSPYTTIHRIAKADGVRGIAHLAFATARERYAHLRVDTHRDNHLMRSILATEDFVYCGIVYMNDGSPRLAYEWWRWDEVPASLQDFVSRQVLPLYDHFDAAHRRDHALRVIARAMTLCRQRPAVNCQQAYTAAAMHDLGLREGREHHHLASGTIIRSCNELHRWFNDAEIELIAQAAEDHRASAATAPRSLLGCIIAEADRDVEPETIVRRTVEYGLSHYPSLDREGHWQRTLQHLHEKYAEGGYIKLWLDHSPNAAPLADLRALIADEARLRPLFDQYYETEPKL